MRIKDNLGKQNFREISKKLYQPLTDTIKNYTSEKITKTKMLTSQENNKTLENFNDKLSEIMDDRGLLATCLLSLLSKNTNPENFSHFSVVNIVTHIESILC